MKQKLLDDFTEALKQEGRTEMTVSGYRTMVARLDRAIDLTGKSDGVKSRLDAWRVKRGRDLERGRIKPSTLRAELTALRTFFRTVGKTNPAVQLRYPKRVNDEFMPRPIPRDQVEKLFDGFDVSTATGLRDRVIVELFLHGLRRIEVIRLNLSSVGFEHDTFMLRVKGKGGRERPVPMRKSSTPLLAAHLLRTYAKDDMQEWLDDAKGDPVEAARLLCKRRLATLLMYDSAPLFVHKEERLTERWVNRMFANYRDRAEIGKEHGPHALRHTCGTELLRGGANLRVVQDILGHTDIRTTAIYTKTLNEERAAAVDALPATLKGGDALWITQT